MLKYYTKLFVSSVHVEAPQNSRRQAACSLYADQQSRECSLRMKNGKVPGNKHINIELIKFSNQRVNRYLTENLVPGSWKGSKTVLLHRKGGKEDLKNYRPICLLSHIYKMFTRITTNRLQGFLTIIN